MNLGELRQLVKQGESYRLEFKEKLARGSDYDSVIEDLCGFANHHGGTVLVGVADDEKIVGIPFKQSTEERLSSKIFDSTDPPLSPAVQVIPLTSGKAVIALTTEGTQKNAHTFKRKPYIRIGSITKPLPQGEYTTRLQERTPQSWEATLCEGAVEDDIDFDAVKNYIRRYNEWNDTSLEPGSREVLLARDLAEEKGGVLLPTRAGILLFGKRPDKFFRMSYISIGQFAGRETTDTILDSKDFYGRLVDIIDEAEKYVKRNYKIMQKLVEGQVATKAIHQYPPWSIRELIVNAAVHRDYSEPGKRIMIFMLRDRIEFHSPGRFPSGITEENVLTSQKTRNPIIARMLHDIGYVEGWGTGLNRVFREIEQHPLKPEQPTVKEMSGEVVVTLYSPEEFLVPEPVKSEAIAEFNPRQKKLLVYIRAHEPVTSSDCAGALKMPQRTIVRDLRELVEKRLITPRGKGPATNYTVR